MITFELDGTEMYKGGRLKEELSPAKSKENRLKVYHIYHIDYFQNVWLLNESLVYLQLNI